MINGHKVETPLYLYLTFNAPHTPYQAPPSYLEAYKNIADPSRRAYAGAITAMDDQIGLVLDALDKKKMRENTLIVFQSDNGGVRNAMFAGEGDMSKVVIPNNNGPYKDGKGSLYEGGTRVVAFANWPGHIKPGSTVAGMVHVVDLYPTLLAIAGGKLGKNKPLDGIDVSAALTQGTRSPRTEVIYNVEAFRAGVREGDWKLIWKTPLPASIELYNIATDPFEKNNVAAAHPDTVAKLQARANELSAQMAKSLMLQTEFNEIRARLALPPALPGDETSFNEEN